MKSVQQLVAEHELIERALCLLQQAISEIEAGRPLPNEFAQWIVRFFRQFADGCHHAKEEDVFFPLLKSRGIPEHGGPIGVMLHEHVVGRDCVRRMHEASNAHPFDADKFAAAARQYLPLLAQHIFKENNILFRMAESVLSGADDAQVTEAFARVEQARGLFRHGATFSDEVSQWEKVFAESRL